MSALFESTIVPPTPCQLQPRSGWMIVLSIYVTLAEKGALGVFVGDGVMEGVTNDKRVDVGSSVNVGKRVGVSVTLSLIGVLVHVGRSWICVIVGVGGNK